MRGFYKLFHIPFVRNDKSQILNHMIGRNKYDLIKNSTLITDRKIKLSSTIPKYNIKMPLQRINQQYLTAGGWHQPRNDPLVHSPDNIKTQISCMRHYIDRHYINSKNNYSIGIKKHL